MQMLISTGTCGPIVSVFGSESNSFSFFFFFFSATIKGHYDIPFPSRFMPPDDPLGRRGPSLDNFLRREALPSEDTPPLCPYQKKCTYGNKCKYFHPERGLQPQKPISDRMAEQAKQKIIIRERKKLAQSMSSGKHWLRIARGRH